MRLRYVYFFLGVYFVFIFFFYYIFVFFLFFFVVCFFLFFFFFFFFSSRRRHTRLTCDWSSDVCSSDLFSYLLPLPAGAGTVGGYLHWRVYGALPMLFVFWALMSAGGAARGDEDRSEEHTSELQSHVNLVCRLLLEKKKKKKKIKHHKIQKKNKHIILQYISKSILYYSQSTYTNAIFLTLLMLSVI